MVGAVFDVVAAVTATAVAVAAAAAAVKHSKAHRRLSLLLLELRGMLNEEEPIVIVYRIPVCGNEFLNFSYMHAS